MNNKRNLKECIISTYKNNIRLPEKKKATLYILYGASGSGKSTLAKIISSKYDAIYISSDDIALSNNLDFSENYFLTFEILNELIDYYLSQGYSVVADSNSDKYLIRQGLYNLAKKYQVKPYTFYIKTSIDIILSRQNERSQKTSSQLRELKLFKEDIGKIKEYLKTLEESHTSESIYTFDGSFDFQQQLAEWESTIES